MFFDGEVFEDFFAQSILGSVLEDGVDPAIGQFIHTVGVILVFQLLGLFVGIKLVFGNSLEQWLLHDPIQYCNK